MAGKLHGIVSATGDKTRLLTFWRISMILARHGRALGAIGHELVHRVEDAVGLDRPPAGPQARRAAASSRLRRASSAALAKADLNDPVLGPLIEGAKKEGTVTILGVLLQKAEGYACTIKNGVVTFREGQWTGEAPGGLIRGPQRVELLEAAE